MSAPVLATKLFTPALQPRSVLRRGLIERLNQGLHRKLTLLSAPAGFGKTTLLSEWIADCNRPAAWLSLDEGDADPNRFLIYLISALQTFSPHIGAGLLAALQSPQPPSSESILTVLLNEIITIPDDFMLVLDDYHAVDGTAVDGALSFLLEHQPPQMHLVIATREDPHLSLARLRVRGQLNELRAADLRFTAEEAAEFLNQAMGLSLSPDDIATLETRTEGWIAGLQLAAISLQGHADTSGFIASFTGSHRFVLDYLLEEVLHQQSEHVQTFLLNTSILERMCGPLCDALLEDGSESGRQTLEHLEHANLFIVPLDSERDWYRYHHLFAELLRQRLRQRANDSSPGIPELHVRASAWFEEHGLEIEAFQHAIAAGDIERTERLIDGNGSPLYVRGQAMPVLNWLASLPASTLNARPWMWVTFATVLSIIGKMSKVEPKLQAAESVMDNVESAELKSQLAGRIKNLREMVGILMADPLQMDAIISRLSDVETDASNLPPSALWLLGLAYFFTGERSAATTAFSRAISVSEATGNVHVTILATTSIGKAREVEIRLQLALETYQRVLQLVGDPPGPVACEAYAGIARILYEWNDLEAARQHAEKSLELALQLDIASFVTSELIVARSQIARGDLSGAVAALAGTAQAAQDKRFSYQLPGILSMQVFALLQQGDIELAEQLAGMYDLPLGRARVQLARGHASIALETLAAYRLRVEADGWLDERFKTMQLQALALRARGDMTTALQTLSETLAIAEPEGLIRSYVDEGPAMAQLLSEAAGRGTAPEYVQRLLAAFAAESGPPEVRHVTPVRPTTQSLDEPLSQRELEILQLIANGLSNREISERLFLALATVKGHNRNIFGKLQVQRRTEAVARARELGIL